MPTELEPVFDFTDFEAIWNVCFTHKITSTLSGYRYWAMYLRSLVLAGRANEMTIERARYGWMNDRHADESPVTEEDISTYEECVGANVKAIRTEDGRKVFHIEVVIWNGNNMYGDRETKRCVITTHLDKMTTLLEKTMLPAIERHAYYLFKKEEDERQASAIHRIQCAMLSMANNSTEA